MKILAFITLFVLSSCNVYELAGQETEISKEFKDLLPKITLEHTTNKVTGTNGFQHNIIRLFISGGEEFTGNTTDELKNTKIIVSSLPSELIGLDTVSIKKTLPQEIEITFNTPSSDIIDTTLTTPKLYTMTIYPSLYTNRTGLNIDGTTQSIKFHN